MDFHHASLRSLRGSDEDANSIVINEVIANVNERKQRIAREEREDGANDARLVTSQQKQEKQCLITEAPQ
jgi:hypothetical protein